MLGYKTAEKEVTTATFYPITLEDDSKLVDEVVVVGYGAVKKSDLTGSVASVKMGALDNLSSTSVDGLLQGRAAGLQVLNTSQDPGAGAIVRIRGNSSLEGSNTPLVVVNGFPMGERATSRRSTSRTSSRSRFSRTPRHRQSTDRGAPTA